MIILTIVIAIVALGIGCLVTYFIMKAKNASLEKELELTGEQEQKNFESQNELKTTIEQLRKDLDAKVAENANIQSQRDTAQKEVLILKEQMQQNKEEQAKALQQQLAMAKEQLQNATQEILKQREETLSKTNVEQIGHVVTPLKEQLEAIQKQVAESIKTTTDNKASLKQAIEDLMKQTKTISDDANNLTRALRNESKIQGNWGEMILEKLLENSGLEKDVHYELQVTLRDASGKAVTHDETGQRLISDAIVHYPDGKDCIIDSKVSLNDYVDYCNAEDEDEKAKYLAKHIASVKKHVQELSSKDYSSYIKPPRTSLNYVIMFVPNDSAMQLALQNDKTLWRDAYDKGVCITSEQNLLILLRMIKLAWTQMQQARNQQEVFDQARKLLDRVADFVERFDKVGEQINKANETFNSAKNKLYEGQQSIVKAAKDMEKLGAKTSPNKQLPEPDDWHPTEAE